MSDLEGGLVPSEEAVDRQAGGLAQDVEEGHLERGHGARIGMDDGPDEPQQASIASGSLPMIMSRIALAAATLVAWVSPVMGGKGQASPIPTRPLSVRTRTRTSLAALHLADGDAERRDEGQVEDDRSRRP